MDSKSYANKYFDYENRTGSIVSFIWVKPLQNCLLSLFLTETFSGQRQARHVLGSFFFFFGSPFAAGAALQVVSNQGGMAPCPSVPSQNPPVPACRAWVF